MTEKDMNSEARGEEAGGEIDADRRAFIMGAAKRGVLVPPAMALLLSTTMSSPAIADLSGGGGGGGKRCYWSWWRWRRVCR